MNRMNRMTMLAVVLVTAALLVASGVVLAKDVSCGPPASGPCVGTRKADGLFGTTGNDEISGRGGNDTIIGDFPYFSGAGNDTIRGSDGDDSLYDFNGGGDIDQVFGGKGNDFIQVADGDGLDEVDCGAGKDEVKADPGDTVAANCEKVS
jgi:Ca2+-binding RTX toxin-like protein